MLRLLAYGYSLPDDDASRAPVLELGIGLMRAMVLLGEQAARLPAGPFHPGCHAGMSFTALRDAAALPVGLAAEAFFRERLCEFQAAAAALAGSGQARLEQLGGLFDRLAGLAAARLRQHPSRADPAASAVARPAPAPTAGAAGAAVADTSAVEVVTGQDLEIRFQARRCIHARFCVTGAPAVFLANVQGAWIHPDAMPVERLVDIAHACPSGAIQYRRRDGQPDEQPPPVNLASLREGGPYAFRGQLELDGVSAGCRATLCRCGASRNKPYCDGSHHEAGFTATGEPPTVSTAALSARDGPLRIDPERDGPLQLTGNLEITSGTGRVVARVQSARLCRCGGSQSKPFCDNTHARIGFRSS